MSTSRFIQLNALYCPVDYLVDHKPKWLRGMVMVKLSKLTKDNGSCE